MTHGEVRSGHAARDFSRPRLAPFRRAAESLGRINELRAPDPGITATGLRRSLFPGWPGAHSQGPGVAVLDPELPAVVHQPTLPTRNRKPLEPNPLARFELRIGALRVYYEVDEARRVVEIRAVGIKDRSRVTIGGEEIELS